jgi:hypothetical protein
VSASLERRPRYGDHHGTVTNAPKQATRRASGCAASSGRGRPIQPVIVRLTARQVEVVAHAASDADNVWAPLSQLDGHAALAARLKEWRGSRLVSSLLLGLLILAAFPTDRSYLTLTDVARKCSISPSTAHRYTHTLIAAGLLERDSLTRQYRRA